MNFLTSFLEYSVREIAVSRDSGRAMMMEINVTARVPVMNGRKPNFFCEGFHSEDVTRSQKEFSCRIGRALTSRPPIIASRSRTDEAVRMNMNTDETFCLYILLAFNDFWKNAPLNTARMKTMKAMNIITMSFVVFSFLDEARTAER